MVDSLARSESGVSGEPSHVPVDARKGKQKAQQVLLPKTDTIEARRKEFKANMAILRTFASKSDEQISQELQALKETNGLKNCSVLFKKMGSEAVELHETEDLATFQTALQRIASITTKKAAVEKLPKEIENAIAHGAKDDKKLHAVFQKMIDLAPEILIGKKEALFETQDSQGNTVLHLLLNKVPSKISENEKKTILLLLQKLPLDTWLMQNKKGAEPLQLAGCRGHVDIMKACSKEQIQAVGPAVLAAIMQTEFGAVPDEHLEVASHIMGLLSEKELVSPDADDLRSFDLAALNGHKEYIQIFLDKKLGALLNIPAKDGDTTLHLLAQGLTGENITPRHLETARLLAANMPDRNLKNESGKTCYDYVHAERLKVEKKYDAAKAAADEKAGAFDPGNAVQASRLHREQSATHNIASALFLQLDLLAQLEAIVAPSPK